MYSKYNDQLAPRHTHTFKFGKSHMTSNIGYILDNPYKSALSATAQNSHSREKPYCILVALFRSFLFLSP